MTTLPAHAGQWRRLVNTAAQNAGSIHDDGPARALGFRGAFVPGSVVGQKALMGAAALLGRDWAVRGWYDLTFVSPVYVDEDVREVAEAVEGGLALRVETRDGHLCCSGRAGPGFDVPWSFDGDGAHGAESVLPGVPLGLEFKPHEFSLAPADLATLLDGSGDDTAWYRDGSLIPPERLMVVALEVVRTRHLDVEGVRNPGMWAGHAFAAGEPLRLSDTYRLTERVVDKGRSGRTVFLTYEFVVSTIAGRALGRGRHKVKWLAAG